MMGEDLITHLGLDTTRTWSKLYKKNSMHKLIATGLGIGYIRKGSGTVAAAVCALVWYLRGVVAILL